MKVWLHSVQALRFALSHPGFFFPLIFLLPFRIKAFDADNSLFSSSTLLLLLPHGGRLHHVTYAHSWQLMSVICMLISIPTYLYAGLMLLYPQQWWFWLKICSTYAQPHGLFWFTFMLGFESLGERAHAYVGRIVGTIWGFCSRQVRSSRWNPYYNKP